MDLFIISRLPTIYQIYAVISAAFTPVDIPPLSPYPEDIVGSSQVFVVSFGVDMDFPGAA